MKILLSYGIAVLLLVNTTYAEDLGRANHSENGPSDAEVSPTSSHPIAEDSEIISHPRHPMAQEETKAPTNWSVAKCSRAYLAERKNASDIPWFRAQIGTKDHEEKSSNIEFCWNGKLACLEKADNWTAGEDHAESNGRKSQGIKYDWLGEHNFTVVTLRDRKSGCVESYKITRAEGKETLSLFNDDHFQITPKEAEVAPPAPSKYTPGSGMDPYGMGELINEWRAKQNPPLPALQYDPSLDGIAHENNNEQAKRNLVGHFKLVPSTPENPASLQNASQRISAYAAMYGDEVYDKVGWVHSKDHNAALLDPDATHYGIAALKVPHQRVGRPENDYYWTLNMRVVPKTYLSKK